MTPQEFADQQYSKGWRDGSINAIQAILETISDCQMEYAASQIRELLMISERDAMKRRNSYP